MDTNNITKTIVEIFTSIGANLPENIKYSISFSVHNDPSPNKHIAFLIDHTTGNIIMYDFNIYYNTNKFPYSEHAEIRLINKYNKAKNNNRVLKKIENNKKILLVVKLSKTGITGNSKPCLECAKYIKHYHSEMNIKQIFFTISKDEIFNILTTKINLNEFRYSKGYKKITFSIKNDTDITNKKKVRRNHSKDKNKY